MHFSAKGVAKMHRCRAARKKKIGEIFSKVECRVLLSKEVVLGHPCIPRVRVNKGGDKDQAWERRGGAGARGGGRGGGTYTRRKGLMQNFM